jgi:hypothetical protein
VKAKLYTLLAIVIIIVSVAVWGFRFLVFNIDDYSYIRNSSNEPYNQNYNSVRKSLGIPPMPKNWYTKKNRGNSQLWSDYSAGVTGVPFHKEKEIHRFKRDIDKETDRYEFIKNDSVSYLLEINYSYLAPRDSPWNVYYIETIDTFDDYLVTSKDLTLTQADSILKSWGLSRSIQDN